MLLINFIKIFRDKKDFVTSIKAIRKESLHNNPKFLLINMPIWDISSPPLSLAYVSAVIKDAGWDCKIIDLNIKLYNLASENDKREWYNVGFQYNEKKYFVIFFKRYKKYIKNYFKLILESEVYQLIGFSIQVQNRWLSILAAKVISSLNPDIPIIFGGPECFPEEYNKKFFFNKYFCPDMILQGECEIALKKFLNEFKKTSNIKTKIKGFIYKENGEIINNNEPELPILDNLDIISDYSQFDFNEYRYPYEFSTFYTKGCPFKCAFCNETFNYKKFRIRKPEIVIKEIKAVQEIIFKQTNQPHVCFNESIFNGNIQKVYQLCDLIIKSSISIHWGVRISFNNMANKELLEKMYQAGCRYCFWGFESANQKVLNLINKKHTINKVKEILSYTTELGIHNDLPIIVGFPGEQTKDFLDTLLFVIEYHNRDYINFNFVAPLQVKPNSLIYKNYRSYGLVNLDRYRWYTEDNRNNYYIRSFRALILVNVIINKESEFHDIRYKEHIKNMDFNAFPLASEIISIIYILAKQSNIENEVYNFIEKFNSKIKFKFVKDELVYWLAGIIPYNKYIDKWYNIDKNSDEIKTLIITFIFNSISKIHKCYYCNSFKKQNHLLS